jgi:hypothetical protein
MNEGSLYTTVVTKSDGRRVFARPGTPIRERIQALSMPEPNTGCWLWLSTIGNDGYPQINVDGKTKRAHRISYEASKGAIPSGLTIDHLCKQPVCVNPDHLEAVTLRINLLRSSGITAVMSRKTHCLRGHELSGDNLYIYPGRRICRACSRMHQKLHKERARS